MEHSECKSCNHWCNSWSNYSAGKYSDYVSGTEESLKKRKELWDYLKEKDPECFKKLRYGIMCGYTNLPGKIGRKVSIGGYKISQKIFKFN